MRCAATLTALFTLACPISVFADARDADATSLRASIDAEPPYYLGAVTFNLVDIALTRAGVSFEIAVSGAQSISISAAIDASRSPIRAGLELGYHLWPLARGVEGLWLGPSLGLIAFDDPHTSAAIDAGWQFIESGWAFGFGAGFGYARTFSQSNFDDAFLCRIRLTLGYAWR